MPIILNSNQENLTLSVIKNSQSPSYSTQTLNFVEGNNIAITLSQEQVNGDVQIKLENNLEVTGELYDIQFNINNLLSSSPNFKFNPTINELKLQGINTETGNNITLGSGGIKLGYNPKPALSAGAGSLRWDGENIQYSNGILWIDLTTSVKATGRNYWIQVNEDGNLSSKDTFIFDMEANQLIVQGTPNITGNNLVIGNGIRIGDNNSTASEAGSGSIRYNGNRMEYSNGASWVRFDLPIAIPPTAPAGNTYEIQFNNGGSFSADSNFTWRPTQNLLTLTNALDTTGNNIFLSNGIRIGSNAATAVNAGAGSLRVQGGNLEFSDGFTWNLINTFAGESIYPDQGGNSGKVLTTNGINVLWQSIPTEIPDQTGNANKYLMTNGTTLSWVDLPIEIPSVSGNNNKYLFTDGITFYWESLPLEIPSIIGHSNQMLTNDGITIQWQPIPTELPSQAGNNGKVLSTNGSSPLWIPNSTSFPVQTGQQGKVLSTDGSNTLWESIDNILPDQTSFDSAVLTTNGITSSWEIRTTRKVIQVVSASGIGTYSFINLTNPLARYELIFENILASNPDITIYLRVSTDNGATWKQASSDYQWNSLTSTYLSTTPKGFLTADSIGIISGGSSLGPGTTSFSIINGIITIWGLYNGAMVTRTETNVNYLNASGSSSIQTGSGTRLNLESNNAIQIYCSSGSLGVGTFKLVEVID